MNRTSEDRNGPQQKDVVKLFGILGSMIPLGIGLTVLGFLWLTPFNQFGSPPLFFRIFGSFIAFGFVLVGAGNAYAVWTGIDFAGQQRRQANRFQSSRPQSFSQKGNKRFHGCPLCGAPLDGSSEISPSGDVKCTHCGKWFNVADGNW